MAILSEAFDTLFQNVVFCKALYCSACYIDRTHGNRDTPNKPSENYFNCEIFCNKSGLYVCTLDNN